MGLWDVISGKVARENRVSRYATDAASKRLGALEVKGTLHAWGNALIWSTDGAVRSFALSDSQPDWRAIANDELKVHRLAVYLASLIASRTAERNVDWFIGDDGAIDDVGRSMLDDMMWVKAELFPPDEVVTEALARTARADEDFARGAIDEIRLAREWLAALEFTMGLPETVDPEQRLLKSLSSGPIIGSSIAAVPEF
ncbi:MAG TPA: hypothetical protein VII30_07625, partial [Gemmatimonadaceae bacterium]